MTFALIGTLFFWVVGPGDPEKIRYVRPAAKGWATECTFTIDRGDSGWTIRGVTERGRTSLTVTARHDAEDQLLEAQASLVEGDRRKAVTVAVEGGKAKVKREGQEPQEFDAPKGVIITSAPDWTDTLLLCRRYDRARGGKQEFAGLWIHPEQPAQRVTFTAERQGSASIEHGGKKLELERLAIRLRGDSTYVAWIDPEGRMVKLLSLPVKPGGSELVLEGFEASAAGLTPE